MSSETHEIVLKGGRANAGSVVRIGDQVARPVYPQTQIVSHFLEFLINAGAAFVPRPLGIDDQGRHRVSFVAGEAPMPPYPRWAFDEALLIDVASHQKEMHRLAASYVPPSVAPWAVSAGDYFPAAASEAEQLVVCHNDLGMTNVIVNDQRKVVGFIDFDYCRPVDRLFDIAVAIRHWAPFGDLDIDDAPEIDRVRRFGLFCDAHSLSGEQRRRVVTLSLDFLEHARHNIKALAAAGQGGFQALLDDGYEATNLSTAQWLQDHTEALVAAR